MSRFKLMVNGLPGKVATVIARNAISDSTVDFIAQSLTGPEIEADSVMVENTPVRLVRPGKRDSAVNALKSEEGPFMAVDFTLPDAVNENAEFYCRHQIPFIMGTTGGDREKLARTIAGSSVCAVIAPNMAKQIVGFQAMMAYAAENFPGLFAGYNLRITESHQKSKADTSGTAKAMVRYFNELGLSFSESDIEKIRDPEIQKTELGVPEAHLDGHGWHTYTLSSRDGTVVFSFTHRVNGREIYAWGTLDAARFLAEKINAGETGRMYSMIDVLQGA
ncbi:MAG TPA: dihydrodipicolinate reductase [Desulfosalsimonadaceae bacterium]|nr:dihydrodipicolinate reductase [Desulfosalsimonadaceae bacterium]